MPADLPSFLPPSLCGCLFFSSLFTPFCLSGWKKMFFACTVILQDVNPSLYFQFSRKKQNGTLAGSMQHSVLFYSVFSEMGTLAASRFYSCKSRICLWSRVMAKTPYHAHPVFPQQIKRARGPGFPCNRPHAMQGGHNHDWYSYALQCNVQRFFSTRNC